MLYFLISIPINCALECSSENLSKVCEFGVWGAAPLPSQLYFPATENLPQPGGSGRIPPLGSSSVSAININSRRPIVISSDRDTPNISDKLKKNFNFCG